MAHVDVVREWFDRVWNEGDEAAIDELMAEDMVTHGLAPVPTVGRPPFKAFYRSMMAAFDSIHVTVDHALEDGDEIAYQATARITAGSPPRTFTITGAGFNRMRNGQLAEGWNHWDFLGLLVELGAVPRDVLETALQRPDAAAGGELGTLQGGA